MSGDTESEQLCVPGGSLGLLSGGAGASLKDMIYLPSHGAGILCPSQKCPLLAHMPHSSNVLIP